MVRHALDAVLPVTGPRTLLVVGANWQAVVAACTPFDGFVLNNDEFANGMASSLALAVRALPTCAEGILIALADQPSLDAACYARLVAHWTGNDDIVCSESEAGLTPPVIFSRRFFDELAELAGDRGARAVIERHSDRVTTVAAPGAAYDVDEPGDLRKR